MFLVLITTNSCENNEEINTAVVERIIYEAVSRGSFYKIVIDKNTVEVINNFNQKYPLTQPCSSKNWSKLNKILKNIPLESIETLLPPSTNSHFDGAASATITVITNSKSYVSKSFDHENPPSKLKDLTEKILSMSKAVENQ